MERKIEGVDAAVPTSSSNVSSRDKQACRSDATADDSVIGTVTRSKPEEQLHAERNGENVGAEAETAAVEVNPRPNELTTQGKKEEEPPAEGGDQVAVEDAAAAERVHPLLNELVLENLFKFCSPKELATCRSVCKTWHDATLSTWRSTAVLKLYYLWQLGTYQLNGGTSLADFLEFWEGQCQSKPYCRFVVEGFQVTTAIFEEHNDIMIRLWRTVGRQMTTLTMTDCSFSKAGDFFQLINGSTPNLETLNLINCNMGTIVIIVGRENYKEPLNGEHPKLRSLRVSGSAMTTSFMELLSHFPRLSSFEISYGTYSFDYQTVQFLNAVETIRKEDPEKLPITLLETGRVEFQVSIKYFNYARWHRQDATEWNIFQAMKLLRSLGIRIRSLYIPRSMHVDAIQEILEWNGPALAWIVAVDHPRCHFPFGVQLEKLEGLIISEDFCQNLEFIRDAPNLKILRIYDSINERNPVLGYRDDNRRETALISNTVLVADLQLLKLTEFQLENTVSAEDLKRLVNWMPNVRKVEMVLNDEQFPILCKNWKSLVELLVIGPGLTDQGVTGRSQADATRPNITCLQNLEVFVALRAALTDESIAHGFLKMDSLSRLYFRNAELMDAEMMASLRQKNIKISRD